MFILIAAFILAFTLLALKNYRLACLFAVALLPAYLIRFNILGLPSTLLEAMIIILLAIWFFKDGWKVMRARLAGNEEARRRLRDYPFKWEIMAVLILMAYFILKMVIAVAGGHDIIDLKALGIIKAYFLEPIMLFLVIINTFRQEKDWQKITGALAISAGAIAAFAIFQKLSGLFIANPFWAAEATRRATSIFEYPNAVGLFLAPIIPLLIALIISLPEKKYWLLKILLAVDAAISVLAIWTAKSEGALIGLAAGLFASAILLSRRTRILALSALVIIVVVVAAIAPWRQFAWEKMSLNDLSGQIRKQQWKETLIVLNSGHLIGGLGINGYQAAIKPIHQEGIFFNRDHLDNFDALLRSSAELRTKYWQPVEIYLYPHNIFLNFWTELGIIGALIFAWLIIRFLIHSAIIAIKKSAPEERLLAIGLFGSMITIIIHGLVDVPYFKNDLSAFFWLIFALLGGLLMRIKEQKIESK